MGHSGASYGFRAFIVLIPDKKAGVFVAMNGNDDSYIFRGPLINLILDTILGIKKSWVDMQILCTFPKGIFSFLLFNSHNFKPGMPIKLNVTKVIIVCVNRLGL